MEKQVAYPHLVIWCIVDGKDLMENPHNLKGDWWSWMYHLYRMSEALEVRHKVLDLFNEINRCLIVTSVF